MKKLVLSILVMLCVGSISAQQKLGHVNSDSLLTKMPSRQKAILSLQKFEEDGYKELQEMEADFNKSVAFYEANQATYSPVIKKIEEEKLRKKSAGMEERQQSLSTELQAVSQDLNKPILGRVQQAIEIVADRKKLSYVFDKSVALYTKGGIDVTAEVLVELLILDAASTPK